MEYKTVNYDFDDKNDVIIWIIKNQLGRRNISSYDRALLAIKMKPAIAEKAKKNLTLSQGQGIKGCQISDKVNIIDTKKELAEIAEVSHDTISKVEEIDKKAIDPIKELIKSNKISINQAEKASNLTPEIQERIIPYLENNFF